MKRFPPPPNTSDLNEPAWRHWFYLISNALNDAVDITTSPGVISSSQGTFPMAGMNGEILEGDSHEYIMSPGTSLSFDAATRLLASSTGMGVTLPLFTATEDGLTPLSGGGTSNFLRADGAWAPTGSGSGREILSTNRTYYVRTDGSDSNNGLANTSGGAFLTIQKAVDVIANTLDLKTYNVTVSIGTGTFTGAITLRSLVGSGYVTIKGGTADLTSTVISTTSADCFGGYYTGLYKLEYIKLQTTTAGNCINLQTSGHISFQNIAFGACAGRHMVSNGANTRITATGNYTINGSCGLYHIGVFNGGTYTSSAAYTVTISGTPALGTYALCNTCSNAYFGQATYSGSATGARYNITLNGVVNTSGQATTWLPGNTVGTTATGGQYA